MRRVVSLVVALSLAVFPAALAQEAPQHLAYNGCHGEVTVTPSGDTISVAYDPARMYQHYTTFVRSYGGGHVAKLEVVELRHEVLKDPADHSGLRDPDSVKRFYRVEYGTIIKTKASDGEPVTAYVQITSGPDGLLLEILTLIPVKNAPHVEGDEPVKETSF